MDVMVFGSATKTPFDSLGPAASVAYNVNAPTDEVQDAGAMLMKAYSGDGLPKQMGIGEIVNQTMALKRAEAAGNHLLMKAIGMLYPDAAKAKARTEPWTVKVGGGGKYVPKPGIPAPVLRQLSKRLEVAQAIHRTRVRQAVRFSQPSNKQDEPGFELFLLDKNAQSDEKAQDYLHWLTMFLQNGGREFDARRRKMLRRESISLFIQKAVQDSLTMDLVAVEKVPLTSQLKGIDSFWVRDSATFSLANFGSTLEEEEVFAYQLAYGTQEIPFMVDELGLWQRNLDSDLNSCGYAMSELEASVDTLSDWVTAMAYTREGLNNNAIPKGVLSVFGSYDRNTKEMFKAAWDSKLRGVANSFNLPMLFGQSGQNGDVKFTPTGQPFNEMAFAKWISLQVSIMGSIYGMDPNEIHIEGFASSGKSSLSGDDTEEKLDESRDTGFAPFMNSLASFMRDEIIAPFTPNVGFRFTGMIDEDRKTRQAEKRRMMTINEHRQELGMDPHPLGWFGNLPADPGLIKEEFQRLNATMTYDEARSAWGGLKVYPSDLVGMAPMNPSMNAMYMTAAQAAGADGGEGGDEDGGAPGENPFESMNPGKGDEKPEGDEDGKPGLFGADEGEAKKPGLFDDDKSKGDEPEDDKDEPDDSLKGDVAAKLKQV
jgi:hypothetical protein